MQAACVIRKFKFKVDIPYVYYGGAVYSHVSNFVYAFTCVAMFHEYSTISPGRRSVMCRHLRPRVEHQRGGDRLCQHGVLP